MEKAAPAKRRFKADGLAGTVEGLGSSQVHGLWKISKGPRLDYYALRKRFDQLPDTAHAYFFKK